MDRMEKVRSHFDKEAQEFDGIIKNLIPYYDQMVEAIVSTIPFENSSNIEVLDLGCGTGTVSRAVRDAYPKANLTCLDISVNMLQMARVKLADITEVKFINSDFYHFDFDKKYDAIVSSLALHHLATSKDKLEIYKKINSSLKNEGILINADIVLASTAILQKRYMEYWKRFMCMNVSSDDIENKWIPKYYEEDRPISMVEHIDMLKEVGFDSVDVVWKYYNFAVYMALK